MKSPTIDWAAISPLVALTAGACLVLMVGLLRPAFVRTALVPGLSVATLGVAVGLGVWQWGENTSVMAGALAIDDLTLSLLMVFAVAGVATVLLSARSLAAAEAGHGEYHALLLLAVLGMVVLVAARRTSSRCSSASSCSRSRSTCCARPSCGASTRSSRASST